MHLKQHFKEFLTFSFSFQRPQTGLSELLYGGVVYLVGVIFFKLDGRFPLAHAIWHICVDIAAYIHWNAAARYLYETAALPSVIQPVDSNTTFAAIHSHQDF